MIINLLLDQTAAAIQQKVGAALQRLAGIIYNPMTIQSVVLAVIGLVLIILMAVRKKE